MLHTCTIGKRGCTLGQSCADFLQVGILTLEVHDLYNAE